MGHCRQERGIGHKVGIFHKRAKPRGLDGKRLELGPIFAESGLRARLIETHQQLAPLHNVALPDQDVRDHTPVEGLNNLHLPRRYDLPVTFCHLINFRKRRPDYQHDESDRHRIKNLARAQRVLFNKRPMHIMLPIVRYLGILWYPGRKQKVHQLPMPGHGWLLAVR